MKMLFRKRCLFLISIAFASVSFGAGPEKKIKSADPVICYHFKVVGEFSGGEDFWINNVYMGKLPLEITLKELLEKVRVMPQAPDGYEDKRLRRPKGNWFVIRQIARDANPKVGLTLPVGPGIKETDGGFYGRVKLGDEFGIRGSCSGGGGGNEYRRDYNININVKFPEREKLIAAKETRFDDLVRIARLQNYKVGDDWYKTMETYGDKGLQDFQRKYGGEPMFDKVIDGWACWKFGIDKPDDEKSARESFKRICAPDKSKNNDRFDMIRKRAVYIVYDKLDLDELIDESQKKLQRKSLWWPYIDALKLWDKKLDAEDYNSTNPVELEIVPVILQKTKGTGYTIVDDAIEIGGPVMAKFLLRNNWKTTDPKDRKNVTCNFHAQFTNRWFLHLINMDDPAGRKFRRQNAKRVMQLVDGYITDLLMFDESPPSFLFLDNELGKESLAWHYWEKYSAHVEQSKPPWQHEKIVKRYRYLARMKKLADLKMYLDVWHDTHKTISPGSDLYQSAHKAFNVLPKQYHMSFGKALIAYCNEKMKNLKPRTEKYRQIYDLRKIIHDNLLEYGHPESIESNIGFYALHKKTVNWKNRASGMRGSMGAYTPYVDYISKHESPNLRELALIGIEYFPKPENMKILQRLLNDPDENVKAKANQVQENLDKLKNKPLAELVAYPQKTKEDNK